MWQYFVYLHRKASTGEPFYVGKGRLKRGNYDRAFERSNRSVPWQRTEKKHGLIVEIIISCMTNDAAKEVERLKIKEIGRRDLGLGPLVNLTDGGEGTVGLVQTEAMRKARSENAKKPRSPAWVASIRRARKNGGNGGVVKRGDKLPEWWRSRIAVKKVGRLNPMFGKTGTAHPMSRKVHDTATKITYPSITAAARAIDVDMRRLHVWLVGYRNCKNPTTMVFL